MERKDAESVCRSIVLEFEASELKFLYCSTRELQSSSESVVFDAYSSCGYWLGETVVTQALWREIMDENPSRFLFGDDYPVERVSWYDCDRFVRRLNGLGRAPSGWRFALPTESQWEYAYRTGLQDDVATTMTAKDYYAAELLRFEERARRDDFERDFDAENLPCEVKSREANRWGFFDMTRSVLQWCGDWFCETPKSASHFSNCRARSGFERTVRGGGDAKGAYRLGVEPRVRAIRGLSLGVRLALTRE